MKKIQKTNIPETLKKRGDLKDYSGKYMFLFPDKMKEDAKVIVARRSRMSLAGYIREAIDKHNKYYETLLRKN